MIEITISVLTLFLCISKESEPLEVTGDLFNPLPV